ncbi:AMP-binding protein, partial [Microbulbifer sp. 2304DJ12-6]|uniref:AMP-binding protein n=1 Tax=Microbulbifer sp. 2304DJ12-6 TaxID=3233340 RepID=UPI0039B0AC12
AGQGPDSLAYMMFTSGSSGQPKGVMTPHIGVIRLLADPNFIELDSNTRFLHFAAHAFDASTLEIWGPLLNGGCCVIYPYKRIDIDELNQVIRRASVTSLFFTAGLFDKWSEQCHDVDSLRWVMTGGDVVSPLAVQRVYRHYPNVTVVNGYGPTENTTFTACCKIPSEQRLSTVPIGLPVTGTSAFVLSPTGSLVPPGCVGELYTGGDGLALGYHNQPDMTAQLVRPSFLVASVSTCRLLD